VTREWYGWLATRALVAVLASVMIPSTSSIHLDSPPFVQSSVHPDPYPEKDEIKRDEKEIIVPRIHEIGRNLSLVANSRGLLLPFILQHQ